jgi:polyphosphate kinase
MHPDGSYEQIRPDEDEQIRNTHQRLMHRAKRLAPDPDRPVGTSDDATRDPADHGDGLRESAVDLDDVYTNER